MTRSWLETGSRSGYDWLASTDTLGDVLRLCPQVVVNKYVAITAFDSGPLEALNEEEVVQGWETSGGIAYSPQVQNPSTLPYDNYDEWYIFRHPTRLGRLAPMNRSVWESEASKGEVNVLVNYCAFALHDPDFADHTELFWNQMDWIRPETYISEGENLNFATNNKRLFEAVHDCLASLR